MAKTKTKISKQLEKKTDTELVETVIAAKRNKNWLKVAEILSGPKRNFVDINLEKIEQNIEKESVIVVPGKVLSQGDLSKKAKIVALKFSEKAKEKLLKSKNQFSSLLEEIKQNPEGKGIKIITK